MITSLQYCFLLFILISFATSLSATTRPSFLGYSLIHLPTTKQLESDTLNININHRFGNVKGGIDTFAGLDDGANTQFFANYGFTPRLSLGIARASRNKTAEGFLKFRFFAQDNFPFAISYFAAAGRETTKQTERFSPLVQNVSSTGNAALDLKVTELNVYQKTLSNTEKQSYLNSLLVSRRINDFVSLQLAGMYIHKNYTKSQIGNSRTGLSLGGRFHLTKHIDLGFESIFTPKRDYVAANYATEDRKTTLTNLNQYTAAEVSNLLNSSNFSSEAITDIYIRNVLLDKPVEYKFVPFSLSLDIETGGHLFQIILSNNQTLAYTALLRGADYDWQKKNFVLGFNLSRLFSFAKVNHNTSEPIDKDIEKEFE
ncbi:MAG: DUF5777 family beta-barrel protein [Spirochaetota bacterium]